MTHDELIELIEPVLHDRLAASGLERVELRADDDHEGSPSLFVHLYFAGQGREVDTDALVAGMVEVRDVLDAAGEERVPYTKFHIPDLEQDAAE